MIYKRSNQESRQSNKRVTRNRKAPIKRIQRVASTQPKVEQPPAASTVMLSRQAKKRTAPKSKTRSNRLAKNLLGSATIIVAVALIASIVYTAFQLRPQSAQPSVVNNVVLPTPVVNAVVSMPEILPTATLAPAAETGGVESAREVAEPFESSPTNLIDPDLPATLPQLAKPSPLDTTPGRLIIPDLGIQEDVLGLDLANNTWDIQSLGLGVGLLESTGRYPGDDFSMVFAGHVRTRWSFWGPFSQLSTLGNGSEVIYQWDGYNFVYEVTGRRMMEPNEGELLFRHEEGTILLLTCIGYDPATGDYAERLLVEAKLVQEPFAIVE